VPLLEACVGDVLGAQGPETTSGEAAELAVLDELEGASALAFACGCADDALKSVPALYGRLP